MEHVDNQPITPTSAPLPPWIMQHINPAVDGLRRIQDTISGLIGRFFNQPFFEDINQAYAEAMHYVQADRLTIHILWLHYILLILLVTLNAHLHVPDFLPSPFGWEVISAQQGIMLIILGFVVALIPTLAHSRINNHYLWRLLVTFGLLSFSYFYIYVSGGAVEMRYHFLLVLIYMTLYADWRIGWYVFSIVAVQHIVSDMVWPGWLYFYGPNNLTSIVNIFFFLAATIFTTVICRNYRAAVEAVILAKQRNDQFLAIASHELKTPLTSIRGYTEVVIRKMKRAHDPSLEYMDKIDDQLTKVINMIRDLLDISVRHSGQVELKLEPLSVETIINQAVEEVQAVAHNHQIEVQGNLRVMIEGDRIRLGQVMANLITNAVKYSPQADKIVVKVVSARDRVVISVQDFGIGISQSEKVKIFEPYFRGTDTQRSDVPGGLGMGLYISDEIVRRHQGRMWVDSTLGHGSTFSFALPLPRVPVSRKLAKATILGGQSS